MAEELDLRVARLEESMARAFAAIDALADKQAQLDGALVVLTEAQINTEQRFRETDERCRETDRRMEAGFREGRERSRQIDERIEKLVVATGEFIRTRDSGTR